MPTNDELKQAIRERAKYICEYCHSPERLSANRFTVDHVQRLIVQLPSSLAPRLNPAGLSQMQLSNCP